MGESLMNVQSTVKKESMCTEKWQKLKDFTRHLYTNITRKTHQQFKHSESKTKI